MTQAHRKKKRYEKQRVNIKMKLKSKIEKEFASDLFEVLNMLG